MAEKRPSSLDNLSTRNKIGVMLTVSVASAAAAIGLAPVVADAFEKGSDYVTERCEPGVRRLEVPMPENHVVLPPGDPALRGSLILRASGSPAPFCD